MPAPILRIKIEGMYYHLNKCARKMSGEKKEENGIKEKLPSNQAMGQGESSCNLLLPQLHQYEASTQFNRQEIQLLFLWYNTHARTGLGEHQLAAVLGEELHPLIHSSLSIALHRSAFRVKSSAGLSSSSSPSFPSSSSFSSTTSASFPVLAPGISRATSPPSPQVRSRHHFQLHFRYHRSFFI